MSRSAIESSGTSVLERAWSEVLWNGSEETYRRILEHPFLTGLVDGSLPTESFVYFLAQDTLYLKDYAKALALVAARAVDPAHTALLSSTASAAVGAEKELHRELLAGLGLDPAVAQAMDPSPTTVAYGNFLLAGVHQGSFAEGLAAVLPCLWIYGRVGAALAASGSPNPIYRRWIDSYHGEEYAAEVDAVLSIVDGVGVDLGQAENDRACERFALGARYEWMFWNAAWTCETWPG